MFGNRGIYHKGWTAVTRHRTPWLLVGEKAPAFDDDVWELYDTSVDWTQFEDVSARASREAARAAAAVPDRGDAQQRAAARRPRRGAAACPTIAGRPMLDQGQPAAALRRHGPPVENSVRQHQEQVARGHGGDRRARGRRAGRDHRAGRQHRRLGAVRAWRAGCAIATTSSASSASTSSRDRELPAGKHQVRMEFAYDGGGLGKGGTVTLYLDGERDRQRPRSARPRR